LRELVFTPFRRKRQFVTAVEDVTLRVRRGEIFGLLGPNGAGKTTLIKLLCNLVIPTSGFARVGGWDVVDQGDRVRGCIGLVTNDERSFFWRLTGRRNLEFFGSLYNMQPDVLKKRVGELLEIFGLEGKADLPFKTYSSGIKKKMAIARGLLNDPQVIFMDEPTNSLDPAAMQQLRTMVRQTIVSDMKKTVFWATHRLEEVDGFCDRVALINNARIEFDGYVRDFKGLLRGNSRYHIRFVGDGRGLRDFMERSGFVDYQIVSEADGETVMKWVEPFDRDIGQEILAHVLRSGGTILNYQQQGASLEDVFMHLVEPRR